jgi:hypothetical protein
MTDQEFDAIVLQPDRQFGVSPNGWWYFVDETEQYQGPYASKELAELGREEYSEMLNGPTR